MRSCRLPAIGCRDFGKLPDNRQAAQAHAALNRGVSTGKLPPAREPALQRVKTP